MRKVEGPAYEYMAQSRGDAEEQVLIREYPKIINTQEHANNITQNDTNGAKQQKANKLLILTDKETPENEKWNENKQYSTHENIKVTDPTTGQNAGREYDIYKIFQTNGRIDQRGIRTANPSTNNTAERKEDRPQIIDYGELEW